MTGGERFDYVIVGSGTAGSVLANRLSEDRATRVCVLEAGGPDRSPFIHIPAGFMHTMTDPTVNWLNETEPCEGTAGRRIGQPRGKTLGGSSSINGHIFNRGQRMDFDVWAQLGNRGWSYPEVLPYFKRSERRIGEADDLYRGRDGPFAVTDLAWRHPLCDAFIEAAGELGIPRNPDYNGADQAGVGYFQRSIHRRRRMSAARAFLRPAMRRRNVEVRTHAAAERILFEGRRARGVRYRRGADTVDVFAEREVIVCGGVVNSPQLLELSGIGAPEPLAAIGVAVLAALPGVGENFRDHYGVRLTVRVKNVDSVNERSRGIRLGLEVAKYLLGAPSILELQPTLAYCFWQSDEALDRPDMQITFTPASYKEGVQSALDHFPGMTCAAWQHRPESAGTVHARSADPREQPIIQPNYLADELDRRVVVAAIRLSRRLLQTEAFGRYYEREISPGEELVTDEELLDYARGRGTTIFHGVGTCRMGPATDASSVVDAQLRVHGLEALRVVDASIMPRIPSANTNASTLMVAEKAADLIRGRPPLPPADVGE